MIKECDFCGVKWNGDTVAVCPSCNIDRIDHRKDGTDISGFFMGEVAQKKKLVNSYRKSQAATWERQHGKQIA